MAELASGAVSSLLSLIRNERRLLGGVEDDVLFIKEEMESMRSFLAHLAKTTPPGVEHDEQVRTWMNQVRLLAQDSNTCIDHYLYRGNPDIHRARGGFWHFLCWAPWFVQKMVAQHRAAHQLRKLKERARDVGERRSRYGVEVPEKKAAPLGQSLSLPGAGGGLTSARTEATASAPLSTGSDALGDDEEEDDDNQEVAHATDHAGRRRVIFKPPALDDYLEGKLLEWIDEVEEDVETGTSIAIVAPRNDHDDTLALARKTLDVPDMFYDRIVLVDIPAVHYRYHPLRPKEILYYILRELELEDAKSQSQNQGTSQGQGKEQHDFHYSPPNSDIDKRRIYSEKEELIGKIRGNIQEMKGKLDKIKSNIQDRRQKEDQLQLDLEQMKNVHQLDKKTLDVLLQLLFRSAAAQQDQVKNKTMHKLAGWYQDIIQKTAEKLKEHVEDEKEETTEKFKEHVEAEKEETTEKLKEQTEAEEKGETTKHMEVQAEAAKKQQEASVYLYNGQYEGILREVFPLTSNNKKNLQAEEQDNKQATNSVEDQIKEMIHKVTEVLQQLQEEVGVQVQVTEDVSTEFSQKIEEIKQRIIEQMEIKWILDKIQGQLNDDTILIILRIDENEFFYKSKWEETRYALALLSWQLASVLIVTNARSIQHAKEYCYPPQRNPIDYSVVGLYHDTVLKLASHQKNDHNYNSQIIHNILEECKPHEFCMKIFAHALHANPKRSSEELLKLHHILQLDSKKSFASIAKKMFKFSYNDMSKEYKSCLLYLAIFPPGHNVRRSTLIGRWVVEGLITKEDWPTSVHQAERCFDALIDRWLIYPGHIDATGKVKSCIVGNLVHGFITNIARKQHIVLTRLSLHLARHFSIFNDVQLGSSDQIDKFFKKLPESSPWSRLKVLDLEGCTCFRGKSRNLKDICTNILLLKYLSLRRTDVKQLPTELNNLHELEVLDICQTEMRSSATKHLLLLKLKRLLADHTYRTLGTTETAMPKEFTSVRIPYKIEKMVNMEVLSNVKASQTGRELKDIRKLWQLRKLGVVIDDSAIHLWRLFRTISDLHECLMSLSITLPTMELEGIHSIGEFPDHMRSHLKYFPKLLESLNISGTTQKGPLLQTLLAKDGNELNKVTLTRTWLSHKDLKVLAKLPNLCCIRLQQIACTETKLTFTENEFHKLKYFLIEGSNLTEISFENGARDLEKIVLSSTNIDSINGVERLKKVEELEMNNNSRLLPFFDNAKQIAKVTLRNTLLKQGDLQTLAKKPNMRSLVLVGISCDESQLTFNKDDFPKLNHLIVDSFLVTKISFNSGSTPKLEKIAWTFTNMKSLTGIDHLLKLKELEFNGQCVPDEVKEAIEKHKNKPFYKHNEPGN